MWRDLKKVLGELRLALLEGSEGTGSYRPDLHYMRGPGPKWHAKYDSLHAHIPQDSLASAPHLDEIAGHRA